MTTQSLQAEDRVLSRFKGELAALYGSNLDRVVLFGSRARGDHVPSSDYDIAVFLKKCPTAGPRLTGSRHSNCPISNGRTSFWT
jgi:predicted nucleotidyltransferase